MKNVQVNNLIFGESGAKICVPVTGTDEKQILSDIDKLKDVDFDLIELRIDYYEHVRDLDNVLLLLKNIRKTYHRTLLFTFRTKKEGGVCELPEEEYFALNRIAAGCGLVDMIDIELFSSEEMVSNTVDFAHKKNVKVIMSNHDFNKTPSKEEIVSRLMRMQDYNADITKIAVMPNCEEDVLTLLSASLEMKKEKGDRPFIAISMGPLGAVTRITGELSGSCLTFASLNNSSAPGQINVKNARELLKLFSIEK